MVTRVTIDAAIKYLTMDSSFVSLVLTGGVLGKVYVSLEHSSLVLNPAIRSNPE
jgi:hypothetical protein